MTLRDIRPAEEVGAVEEVIANMADTEPVVVSGPWTHILRDGRKIQVEVSAHTISFEGKRARFSLVQDVTERQQLHHRLLHQAHHDMLTGLPNRLLLLDRMEQALASAARRGKKAAVMCMDLDRFKQINDTYGHAVGDLCLKHVAERLKSRLRAEDTVARSGGEEFTVVVGDLVSADDATRIVEDLLAALRKPLVADQYPIDLTASFGIALYPDHGTDAGELWRNADAAMYRVKRSGGNDFVLVSQEISQSTTEANELELFMRRAVKEGGLELYYQPEYGRDGEICGLEALLRLHHPKFGMVSPERFIPIAEESGLIVPMGNWVLREVCRQSKEWARQGLAVPRIAINVSPLQFMRMDFSRQVRQAVLETGGGGGHAGDRDDGDDGDAEPRGSGAADAGAGGDRRSFFGGRFWDGIFVAAAPASAAHREAEDRPVVHREGVRAERDERAGGGDSFAGAQPGAGSGGGGRGARAAGGVPGADAMRCDAGVLLCAAAAGRGDSGADPAGACARGVESGAGGGAGVIRFGCDLEPLPASAHCTAPVLSRG
jgi:diguanylate cyclase (GGDEF)-like protein